MKFKSFSSRLFTISIIALALILQSFAGLFAQNNSPLCFTAKSAGATVSFNLQNGFTETIQTSLTNNGTDWVDYNSGTEITLSNIGDHVYFRSSSNHTKAYNGSSFVFTGNIESSGNIMSLYGPTCPNIALPKQAFIYMFTNCNTLLSAPELPATELSESCYNAMFYGCTSLKESPSLPATILFKNCYNAMFYGCTSLTTANAISATTMAERCCYAMFYACTSLKTAPALPATILANGCYSAMFQCCKSLTSIPTLPATTLVEACYVGMFAYCDSLQVNYEQPGKTWQIPSNATATTNDWNASMFENTGGTFTGNPEIGVTYYVASDTTTTTDVENVIDEPNVAIYPNPIHVGETVYMNTDENLSMVEVYNIEGECVQRIQNPERVIEITGLNANGVYIIKMINANGQITSQKLIVD